MAVVVLLKRNAMLCMLQEAAAKLVVQAYALLNSSLMNAAENGARFVGFDLQPQPCDEAQMKVLWGKVLPSFFDAEFVYAQVCKRDMENTICLVASQVFL